MFLLGGCCPDHLRRLLFLGGFQPPDPLAGGLQPPCIPLRLSGSPFFFGAKILGAPNLWVRCCRRFYFQKNGPIFLKAPNLRRTRKKILWGLYSSPSRGQIRAGHMVHTPGGVPFRPNLKIQPINNLYGVPYLYTRHVSRLFILI